MKHKRKKILSYIVTLIVIAVAAIWIGSRFIHLGDVEFTDNAQVRQQVVPVNSRVQGYIKEIRFKEYQKVKKGDTLVIIDDSDLRLNLARARADYQNAVCANTTCVPLSAILCVWRGGLWRFGIVDHGQARGTGDKSEISHVATEPICEIIGFVATWLEF